LGPEVPFAFTGRLTSSKERPQQQAHDKCVVQLCDTGGALLVLPCGFGKTVVSLAIASSLKRKTLIIVTSVELAHQWTERIQQFVGCAVGWIQGDTCDTEKPMVIAMLQTLLRRQPDLTMFGTCLVDEAHHVAARSFSQVMPLVPCRYILGLSATPKRKDGLKKVLHWCLGTTAFEAQRDHDPDSVPNVMRCKVTEGKQRVITYKNGEVGRSKMITLSLLCTCYTWF
jgi:superfamily II DNA or RNA helicase